jgi:Escherichia/Staphylococcus phage prohead protease
LAQQPQCLVVVFPLRDTGFSCPHGFDAPARGENGRPANAQQRSLLGAFDKTLQERHTFPLLWQHNPSLPIGSVQISDSDVCLHVDGKLVLEDPQARIALTHLKAKTIKGLSIGFDTIKDVVESGVRHLKELRLWEVSVVTFPMNEDAMVTSVKSIDDARRIMREAAANPDVKAALRSLLKESRSLLDSEDDEEEEGLADDTDEKEIALALRSMVLELKAMRVMSATQERYQLP